jgi:hypothetical protein
MQRPGASSPPRTSGGFRLRAPVPARSLIADGRIGIIHFLRAGFLQGRANNGSESGGSPQQGADHKAVKGSCRSVSASVPAKGPLPRA